MAQIKPDTRPVGFLEALGSIAFLSLHSKIHREWTIAIMEDNYLPALKSGQCKIYYEDGNPTAFVTWALLTDDAHEQIKNDGLTPPADQWNLGNNLWFMDIVAPFGNSRKIIRDMQKNHFPDRHAYSLKRNVDGSVDRIKIWKNMLVSRTKPEWTTNTI